MCSVLLACVFAERVFLLAFWVDKAECTGQGSERRPVSETHQDGRPVGHKAASVEGKTHWLHCEQFIAPADSERQGFMFPVVIDGSGTDGEMRCSWGVLV